MIFGVEQSSYDAIYFLHNHKVIKEMVFGEFEAVLDGVVSEAQFAGEECHAVYLKIDKRLNILAAVFFVIEFDADGGLKLGWNLPLDQLAETAGYGPTIHGSQIRMACRSQCPIAWLANELWEPDLGPTKNTLKLLATEVKKNRLGFYVEKGDPSTPPLVKTSADGEAPRRRQSDFAAPASNADIDSELSLKNATGADYERVVAALTDREENLRANLRQKRKNERDQALLDQRDDMAQGIKKLRVRLASQQEQHHLEIDKLKRQHAEELDRHKYKMDGNTQQQLALEKKHSVLKNENAMLQEQLEEQRKYQEKKINEMAEQSGFDHESMRKHMRRELQAKLIEHTSELESRLELKEVETKYREEQVKRLQREIAELKITSQEVPAHSDFVQEAQGFEELGMHFLISLPAVGPVRVPAVELSAFNLDPNAYLAARHGIQKNLFTTWYEHAKHPVCNYQHRDGGSCDEPIKPCKPQQFDPGVSDRCSEHEHEDGGNVKKYG